MVEGEAGAGRRSELTRAVFCSVLLVRLLYPFFNSPLSHLFSDPQRHWDNGSRFLTPSVLGSSDPFLYQLWIFILRGLTGDSPPAIALGCGALCAAMPYGWYRALRELQPRARAFAGAALIGAIPESLSIYGYFMTETLLMSLLGFCFWATLRARRKESSAAYAAAVAFWLCAAFTRTVVVPMAALCLALLWFTQGRKVEKALLTVGLALLVAVPAGLHARIKLGFFAPLGNLYFNEIYSVSGRREIAVDYGPEGSYHFGCPSFYAPTFYPFSDWTTNRSGVVSFSMNLAQGRAAWIAERARAAAERTFPTWRMRAEGASYALFGQSWPNSDRSTLLGWLTIWTRWVWAPLVAWLAAVLLGGTPLGGRFTWPARLLPICGLGTVASLLLQNESVMEARYREPVDAILVCAALLVTPRRRRDAEEPKGGA